MKGLAELVVSLCDLCEAEGRLLEAGILRTVRRAGLLSLGLLFGGAALALFLGALYALLTALLPTPAALALLGLASAAVAGFLLWKTRTGAAPAVPKAGERARPREDTAAQAVPGSPHAGGAGATSSPKTDGGSDIWADVAPYGHSAGPGRDADPDGPRASPGNIPESGDKG